VSRADLWWLIASAAAGGAAVLMSTTYLDEASRAARVLVLDEGRTLAAGTPAEIVAAIPGTISIAAERPEDEDERRRSWRRAGAWRIWQPAAHQQAGQQAAHQQAGREQAGKEQVTPDLQDAVCVAALRRELEPEHA
jgi:ABC-2 type transport system ATP-binding protein